MTTARTSPSRSRVVALLNKVLAEYARLAWALSGVPDPALVVALTATNCSTSSGSQASARVGPSPGSALVCAAARPTREAGEAVTAADVARSSR